MHSDDVPAEDLPVGFVLNNPKPWLLPWLWSTYRWYRDQGHRRLLSAQSAWLLSAYR